MTDTYPVVDPANVELSPLAVQLFENRSNPKGWVFVEMTDWKSAEAADIRHEVRSRDSNAVVEFRGWTHNGVRGTIMHLAPG